MIKFIKHIPNFARDFDEEENNFLAPQEYSCIQDVLENDWCHPWKDNDFINFSLARGGREGPYKYILMVEQKNKKFWVLGYLDRDVPELPSWIYPEEK